MRPLIIIALACALAGCPPMAEVEKGATFDDHVPVGKVPVPSYTKDDDSDWSSSAAPSASPEDARAASFKANNDAALAQVAQGQHARYKPYATPEKAIECEQLLGAAEAAVPGAAAEMLNNQCARGDMVRPAECPAVAALVGADAALADAKCPARPRYPTLRDK